MVEESVNASCSHNPVTMAPTAPPRLLGKEPVETLVAAHDDDDSPKITVYSSPPRTLPVRFSKDVEINFDRYPPNNTSLHRAKRMNLSRSLEVIPENTVIGGQQKVKKFQPLNHSSGSPHPTNSPRASPRLLPPICPDLPMMRDRSYSDPHRYTRTRRRDSPDMGASHKKSPLALEKKASGTSGISHQPPNARNNIVPGGASKAKIIKEKLAAAGKTQLTALAHTKENRSTQNGIKMKTYPVLGDHHQRIPASNERRIPVPPPRHADSVDFASGSPPCRPVLLGSSPTSRHSPVVSPRCLRREQMPASMCYRDTPSPGTDDKESRTNQTGGTTRTAYALVGSPGRNRWPEKDRDATSYIRPGDISPPDDDDDKDSVSTSQSARQSPVSEASRNATPLSASEKALQAEADSGCSNEFQNAMREMGFSGELGQGRRNILTIDCPQTYFNTASDML